MTIDWSIDARGEGSFSGVLSPWGFISSHVVDINVDGYEDIIAFEGVYPPTPIAAYPLHILISDGAGGYIDQSHTIIPNGIPISTMVMEVQTADFNGDGRPDLFISDFGYDDPLNQPGGSNILLLSNPDGTLTDASAGLNQLVLAGFAVTGDIDSDGDLDIVDIAIGPRVTGGGILGPALYINNGNENFTNVSSQLPDWITDQTVLGGSNYITNDFYRALLQDLNGDGAAELILGQGPRQGPVDDAVRNSGPVPAEAVIFWNDGTGNFSNDSFTALTSPIWGKDADYGDIKIADFNGDGKLDIVTSSSNGTEFRGYALTLQTGDGHGNFTDVTASAFPLGYTGAEPTLGRLEIVDIELDGDLDIVALEQRSADGSEAPLVWLNNGSGVFDQTVYWSSILDRDYPGAVVLSPDGTGYNFVWLGHDPGSQTGSYTTFWTQFDSTQVRTISGTENFDQIIGGKNSETIHGLGGKDILFGQGGNDTLTGGGGNDILDGGADQDTAVFTGPRSDYVVFTATTGKALVVDIAGSRDGKDSLQNVENIQFGSETVTLANALVEPTDADDSPFQVYRFYNSQTGSHFFTTSLAERNSVIETLDSLSFEGNSFDSNVTDVNGTAVFRFFNLANNVHFYTANSDEAAGLRQNSGFRDEGISYYASNDASNGGTELFRFFNTKNGSHFYTVSAAERDNIISTLGHYNYEGVAFFVDVA